MWIYIQNNQNKQKSKNIKKKYQINTRKTKRKQITQILNPAIPISNKSHTTNFPSTPVVENLVTSFAPGNGNPRKHVIVFWCTVSNPVSLPPEEALVDDAPEIPRVSICRNLLNALELRVPIPPADDDFGLVELDEALRPWSSFSPCDHSSRWVLLKSTGQQSWPATTTECSERNLSEVKGREEVLRTMTLFWSPG